MSDANATTEGPATDAHGAVVAVEGLTHRYPPRKSRRGSDAGGDGDGGGVTDTPALSDVSLAVNRGEVFGVLGPNGGGKSTLFRILSTMLRPSEGSVRVAGDDPTREPAAVRQHIGVVFQHPSLDAKLTARENLTHEGHLYGLRGGELRERIDTLLQTFGLAERGSEAVEAFSGGMRRRVELAKAMLHRPTVLLMDEPSTGLDPAARSNLWQAIRRLQAESNVTVLLTTHLMDEAERCDRLAVLSQGRLVAVDTPAALKAMVGGEVISIVLQDDVDADALLEEVRGIVTPRTAEPQLVDGTIRVETADAASFVPALSRQLHERIRGLSIGQPSLEDAFMHLTGRQFT